MTHIPKSKLYEGKSLAERLLNARWVVACDRENVAMGWSADADARAKLELLEAEYERTYGHAAPESDWLLRCEQHRREQGAKDRL